MKNLLAVTGLFVVLLSTCSGKLPSSITTCSRHEPNLSECILVSVNELRPKLSSGFLDKDFTVPGIDPLTLDTIRIDRGPDFKVHLNKIVVKGASGFQVEQLKVNLANTTFEFIIKLPNLEFNGKYSLKARIVILLQGKGDLEGNAQNSRARVRLAAKKYQKDGQTYLKFDPLNLKVKIGTAKLNLKNLFNGDKNLEQIGNQFINDNTELFLGEVIPGLEKSLSDIITEAANDIVANATFDELFPDVPPRG